MLFQNSHLAVGRMISGSKSGYRSMYPDNEVYFNANIFTKEGKVWFGDLDLTKEDAALQSIADESKKTLYVLSEMDGRFENENLPEKQIKKVAKRVYKPKNELF